MKPPIRKIVLDVLKPIKGPSVIEIAEEVASIEGVDGVNVTVMEIDVDTMTLMITVEGKRIDYKKLEERLERLGCVVHSIDRVAAGNKVVEEGIED